MATHSIAVGTEAVVELSALAAIIPALKVRGYEVIGPAISDGAIVYQPVDKLEELPAGWTMEQAAASCRLKKRSDAALFGFAAGPRSLKNFLHPSEVKLFAAERENGVFRILEEKESAPRYAFFGVRPCDLAAAAVQDRVLLGDHYADATYEARRRDNFVVVAQCTHPAPTCFCTSMKTGPRAESGFDLALTEIAGKDRHVFLVEVGSEAGGGVLAELGNTEAPRELVETARQAVEKAASRIKRRLDTEGIRDLLYENFGHARWDQVAARCLSCANCTMVCPTCFCVTVEDASDVTFRRAERWRKWDSCFTQSFSYIHGGSVRLSPKSRYRQWLTHKFAAWIDQFGSSGCVGCGRCITWCPAGIDVTEEVAAIRASGKSAAGQGDKHDQE